MIPKFLSQIGPQMIPGWEMFPRMIAKKKSMNASSMESLRIYFLNYPKWKKVKGLTHKGNKKLLIHYEQN